MIKRLPTPHEPRHVKNVNSSSEDSNDSTTRGSNSNAGKIASTKSKGATATPAGGNSGYNSSCSESAGGNPGAAGGNGSRRGSFSSTLDAKAKDKRDSQQLKARSLARSSSTIDQVSQGLHTILPC